MADSDLFSDQVRIVLTAQEPYPASHVDILKERELVLSPEAPTVPIGRTSKRNPKLEPTRNNGWIDAAVMSREHAVLRLDACNRQVYVKDVGSLHGTWQNGVRLAKDQASRVRSGDILKFGIAVERSLQQFPPCVMRVQIHHGTNKRPVSKPLVFKVPDDTDVEDTDDDFSIQNSVEILRESGVQPAKRGDSSNLVAIDLTVEEEYGKDRQSDEIPTVDGTAADVRHTVPQGELQDSTLKFSDMPDKTESAVKDSHPNETAEVDMGNIDESDVPEADWEDYNSASPDASTPCPTSPINDSSSFADRDEDDDNSDFFELYSEGEGEVEDFDVGSDSDSIFSITLAEALAERKLSQPPYDDKHEEADKGKQPTVEHSTRREPEQPTPAKKLDAVPLGPFCDPLNMVLEKPQAKSTGYKCAPDSTQTTIVGLGRMSSDTSLAAATTSLPTPLKSAPRSMAELLGAKTGKYEFFEARACNQFNTIAPTNKPAAQTETGPTHGNTDLSNLSISHTMQEVLSRSAVLDDVQSLPCLPMTPVNMSRTGDGHATSMTNLLVSGQNFLNSPLEFNLDSPQSPQSELNETSAYQFELSKNELSERDAAVKAAPPVHFAMGLDPPVSRPKKRKAEDFDEPTSAHVQETDSEPRAIKRLRRAAEVFGYAAIGGVAVMSALIATAPAL
ncbi:hypothetical protein HIM_02145 [Hirsutella minnesotensis 3608]|nr:hypothetical protein HIM_02145 [Hirsutella minnesotensis 3608]